MIDFDRLEQAPSNSDGSVARSDLIEPAAAVNEDPLDRAIRPQTLEDYVGQAVGLMNSEQSARSVVYDFMRDYADAAERLAATLEE